MIKSHRLFYFFVRYIIEVMKKKNTIMRIMALLLIAIISMTFLGGCKKNNKDQENSQIQETEESEESQEAEEAREPEEHKEAEEPEEPALDEDGEYYSKEEVALYLNIYGHLPDNFITKKEAKKLGWSGGSLEKFAPGKVIGGDNFGNYEGNLPEKSGRKYYECDIDTYGKKSRGAKRIVWSSDGNIYYTEDHYETFELLYGEEEP